jgi:hypothetical protein
MIIDQNSLRGLDNITVKILTSGIGYGEAGTVVNLSTQVAKELIERGGAQIYNA